jgi:hypothetical protein
MKPIHVGLALPTLQTWDADFSISIVNLYSAFMRHKIPGFTGQQLSLLNRRSSMIPKNRQELVQDAQKHDCTHILFIDSDQVFPPSIIHRLVQWDKAVIACNIATKAQGNSIPTARKAPKPGEWWGGHVIYSNGKKGIERVWRIGAGVIMMKMGVFDDLPLPWFNNEWRGEPVNDFCGEDWFFCELMDKKGIPIWIDHGLSLEIGHVGKWIYGHDGVVGIPKEQEAA